MIRPLVRHWCGWWRIFIGHSDHALPDRYTSAAQANDAAARLKLKENTWR